MKKPKRKSSPPYVGSMVMHLPGGAEVKIKLPSAEGYQLGEMAMGTGQYKGREVKAPVIRIVGGWDVVSQ